MLAQHHELVVVYERGPAGQTLEQHAGHCIQVGRRPQDPQPLHLFRAHVAGCAERNSRAGELFSPDLFHRPCDPEVEQHRPGGGQHDVLGLYVAVDDPAGMGVLER